MPPSFSNVTLYRRLVGSLQYLTFTRPNIAFVVNCGTQFLQNPTIIHHTVVKRILRNLCGTPCLGILFKPEALTLQAFCDADWAGDASDHRSTTGYVVLLGSSRISKSAKKQPTVLQSSIEVEYRVLANIASNVYWL